MGHGAAKWWERWKSLRDGSRRTCRVGGGGGMIGIGQHLPMHVKPPRTHPPPRQQSSSSRAGAAAARARTAHGADEDAW